MGRVGGEETCLSREEYEIYLSKILFPIDRVNQAGQAGLMPPPFISSAGVRETLVSFLPEKQENR